jgi:hypothetical protein
MKKAMTLTTGLVIMMALNSCMNQQGPSAQPELVKAWETDAVFSVPESVCYEPGENVLYIANINGNPTDQDSNGFISKCSLNGEILELKWAEGLHAPKGMGIHGGRLFVSDINRVAEIDLADGKIVRFYEVPEATFLNDIDIDGKGRVYISDMMDTKIYRIADSAIGLWIDDPVLTGPNGLYALEGQLMIGCKKIVKAGLEDKTLEVWLSDTGGIDGLESTGDGRFLFSDWQGSVYLVNEDRSINKILDLTTERKNAADIEFIPSKKMLFVPTFGANTVIAYKLKN